MKTAATTQARVDGEGPSAAPEGRGYFFAIDRRGWHAACDLGLNAAVCYLLMARGTLHDNRTTYWSVNAVEHWSGISRPRARVAVETLLAEGLVESLNKSRTKPRRGLVAGHLLPQVNRTGLTLTKAQTEMLASLPIARRPLASEKKAALDRLIQVGVARFDGSQYLPVDLLSEQPDWIWLPNSLIDAAADETSPVEMLRMGQEVAPLRLLVDLYHSHSLSFFGGIPTSLIRMKYTRKEVAHQREYRIWHCEEDQAEVCRDAPFFQPFLKEASGSAKLAETLFWQACEPLWKLGYIHFIGHIFEGAGADSEIIHPYEFRTMSSDGYVTKVESELQDVAHDAAIALLPDFLRPVHLDNPIFPVRDTLKAVEMRGILRLLYRPRTIVTSQWKAQSRKWEWWIAHYKALIAKLPPVKPF